MTLRPREDIYVTLPSNVPGVQGNTPSQYTTIFPRPLQLHGLWEVALLETHYANHMRNMLSRRIAVVELTHARGLDAIATNPIVNELLKLIVKTDGSGTDSEAKSKPTPEAEMQSDDPGIETPQARKESESKSLPAPLDEMQSDGPSSFGTPPPQGRERVLLAMSKDYVQALPAHQAKLRSLAYNKAAARFKVSIGETPKAHDVSSYIIQAMMDLQKTGGSAVKYLGTKDTTLEDNEAQQVEMVKALPAESALEAIALKMCMAASETETKGSLKLCNLTVPPLHYRDLAEFVEYLGKLFKQAEFTSDIEFEFDKVTSKFNIKSQSLFLIIAFDDYLFKRLGFKASSMKILGKNVSIITSQMKGESRATLDEVHTIFIYSDTID